MAKTKLQIDFHLKGPKFDPDLVTKRSGVQPTRSFKVGEQGKPNAAIHKLAGWEWRSQNWEEDDEPLWDELLRTLTPAIEAINEALESDPDVRASVDIYGRVTEDLITTVQGLKDHQYILAQGSEEDPYEEEDNVMINDLPMLEGERVGICMQPEVIQFLATINATFDSDIEIVVDEDECWKVLRQKLADERANN